MNSSEPDDHNNGAGSGAKLKPVVPDSEPATNAKRFAFQHEGFTEGAEFTLSDAYAIQAAFSSGQLQSVGAY